MKFTPMSELSKGTYQAQVTHAEEKISAAGNEMLKVTMMVWDNEGHKHSLSDLLFGFKLKNFCEVAHLEEEYKSGEIFPNQIVKKEMLISVDEEEYINKTGEKAKAMKIKKYLLSKPSVVVEEDINF